MPTIATGDNPPRPPATGPPTGDGPRPCRYLAPVGVFLKVIRRSWRSRSAGIALSATCLALALFASTASATFPGADGRILFQRYSPQYGVFTMAPDGSDVRRLQPRLGPSGGWDGHVDMSWSANGRWIVYTCYPESAVYTQLCMMRADGSDSHQVGNVARGSTPRSRPAAEESSIPKRQCTQHLPAAST